MFGTVAYHIVCLAVLLILYISSRETKKKGVVDFFMVYIMVALVIISDCTWEILKHYGVDNQFILYLVNEIYFIASMFGIYSWTYTTLRLMNSVFYRRKWLLGLISLPAVVEAILVSSTPWTGCIFFLENGAYEHGAIFFIDTVIKVGYLFCASLNAIIIAAAQKKKYLKRKYLVIASFSIPVLIGGVLQTVFSMDFNCVSTIISLAIIFNYGISNEQQANINILKSIARTYSASFIVDADDHTVRTLFADEGYEKLKELAEEHSYETCAEYGVENNVMPEDRMMVRQEMTLDNIVKQLEEHNTYSLIYRAKLPNAVETYNRVTLMNAFDGDDRHEIFLGIEKIDLQQIIMQREEALEKKQEEFERVKESLTEVIAEIIEGRDVNSGEHVHRVKNITQRLCNQVIRDCPEYGLNSQMARYIVNGSALHDVGKIMIPDAILLKPGRLTPQEVTVMRTHCEKGCQILDRLPMDLDREYVNCAKAICLSHHEKYDGSGYPNGIKGDEIPISAQIVALADCYEALTAKRVYKDEIFTEDAFKMLKSGACGAFNPKLIKCLRKVLDDIASGKTTDM